jgi:twitching motility two-component system response regulator PilG
MPSPYSQAAPETTDSSATTHAGHEGGSSRPSIMVIDDSIAVRTVIQMAFNRVGVDVSAFADGISAIKALTRNEVPVPSVLLLDLGLPRMNGYEVATLLRSHEAFAHTILLMLTARDGMIHRVHSRMIGARDYITKPFRVGAVVEKVCGYLNVRVPSPTPEGFNGTKDLPS